jgi:hypothetical protein
VFGPEEGQQQVFEAVGAQLVENCMAGKAADTSQQLDCGAAMSLLLAAPAGVVLLAVVLLVPLPIGIAACPKLPPPCSPHY